MKPTIIAGPIWGLFCALAFEAAVVIGLVAALQAASQSAIWRRTAWQIGLLALAVMIVFQATGVATGLGQWLAAQWQPAPAVAPTETPAVKVTARPTTTENAALEKGGALKFDKARAAARPALGAPGKRPLVGPLAVRATRSWPNGATAKRSSAATLNWLGPIWLLGLVLVLGWVVVGRGVLWLFGWEWAEPAVAEKARTLAPRLGIRRRVRVLASRWLVSPIAFGTIHPTVGLPENFSTNFSRPQQEAILAHELAHLAAHDPLWHLLADGVSVALWWHPLVWWLRHRLQTASETAADEASLLLEDGPRVLAECLVVLGKSLPGRPSLAWLRIQGNGFRSGLGRRVERLLKLEGRAWPRRNRLGAWLAGTLGPTILLAVTIVVTGWETSGAVPRRESLAGAVESAWHRSLASSALGAVFSTGKPARRILAGGLGEDAIAPSGADGGRPQGGEPTGNTNRHSSLMRGGAAASRVTPLRIHGLWIPRLTGPRAFRLAAEGVTEYQIGNFDLAEARLRLALGADPNTPLALHYLMLIRKARLQPTEQRIEGIILQKTPQFVDTPLCDVMKFLTAEVNPRGQGALLLAEVTNVIAGLRLKNPLEFRAAPEVAHLLVTVFAERRVPLADYLRLLTRRASPLTYTVNGERITFSQCPLYTRTWKLAADTLTDELDTVMAPDPELPERNALNVRICQLFANLGWSLPVTTWPAARSFPDFNSSEEAVFFSRRTDTLFVRGTMADLDLVDQTLQTLDRTAGADDGTPPQSPTATVKLLPEVINHQRIYNKLNRITIPTTKAFVSAPLAQVVDWLESASRRCDPAKEGVVFVLGRGLGHGTSGSEEVVVSVPVIHNIRLDDLVNLICKIASRPILYTVHGSTVVISPYTPEPPHYYTRTYKVDAEAFVRALEKADGQPTGGEESTSTNPPVSGASTPAAHGRSRQTNLATTPAGNSPVWTEPMLRRFFASLGIELKPPRGAWFNERAGLLFVRATTQDLDLVDHAIQVIDHPAPRVTFVVKGAQCSESVSKTLGLDRFLTNQMAEGGVLSAPAFHQLLHRLEQHGGVDILTMPTVTTVSGRLAKIKWTVTRTIVTGVAADAKNHVDYQTSRMDFGPTVTVLPKVRADGNSIDLTVDWTVKQFEGYDDPREVKIAALARRYQQPLPRYRTSQIKGSAVVWDGQTLVLAGPGPTQPLKLKDKVPILGDIPLLGRLFRRESTSTVRTRLLIFVTPTLVDASGNRVRPAH